MQEAIRALLRVKHIIDGLAAIEQMTLTETEQEAIEETRAGAYDRVSHFLPQVERFLKEEQGTASTEEMRVTAQATPPRRDNVESKKGWTT